MLLAELTLKESKGVEKEKSNPQYLVCTLNPPYNPLHHGNIQLPKQACSFQQFPLYFTDISGAFYHFTHKKHL